MKLIALRVIDHVGWLVGEKVESTSSHIIIRNPAFIDGYKINGVYRVDRFKVNQNFVIFSFDIPDDHYLRQTYIREVLGEEA